MAEKPQQQRPPLRTAEVARMLKVSTKTVARYCTEGRIKKIQRTLGGHRRYDRNEIEGLVSRNTNGQAGEEG